MEEQQHERAWQVAWVEDGRRVSTWSAYTLAEAEAEALVAGDRACRVVQGSEVNARKLYRREVWWRQYGVDAGGRPMLMLTSRDGTRVYVAGSEQDCRAWIAENVQ